jgi:hypothetical protein
MLRPAAGRQASTLEEGSSLSRHRIVQLATVWAFLPVARPAMCRVMWHNSCCWIILSLMLAVLLRPFVRTEIVVAAADGVVGSRRICLRQLRGPNLQPMVLWLCVIYSLSVYFNLFRTNGYAIQYPYVHCILNQRTGLPGCCVCQSTEKRSNECVMSSVSVRIIIAATRTRNTWHSVDARNRLPGVSLNGATLSCRLKNMKLSTIAIPNCAEVPRPTSTIRPTSNGFLIISNASQYSTCGWYASVMNEKLADILTSRMTYLAMLKSTLNSCAKSSATSHSTECESAEPVT